MAEPDSTAVRVALWRAMHLLVDAPPHMLEDDFELRLVAPADDWRTRPDMDPGWTSPFRAGMVARARFVEDLVAERAAGGVAQYVMLGAGLDTFAQRRPDLASQLRVFEIDQPEVRIVFGVPDADAFPAAAEIEVVSPFEDTHWGTKQMVVRDPDGRLWNVQAPRRG